MEFREFNIEFRSESDGRFEVKVKSEGSVSKPVVVALDGTVDELLARLAQDAGPTRSAGPERAFSPEQPGGAAEPDAHAKAVGQQLYTMLFSAPEISKVWGRCTAAAKHEEVGVRLKFTMNMHDPAVADLARLPWELLYDDSEYRFLSTRPDFAIVRCPEVDKEIDERETRPPLRVLIVSSNPRKDLLLDRERDNLRKTLTEAGIGFDVAEGASIQVIEEKLATAESDGRGFSVVHYMGHGDFNGSKGVLLLENAAGHEEPVDALLFNSALLAARGSVRLVFLNACNTAQMAGSAGADPFAGVATALVFEGVPAVVAMQRPVPDDAAILLAKHFYSSLAKGLPLEAAVAAGRRQMEMARFDALRWAIPVLFMRSPDGFLFKQRGLDAPVALHPATVPATPTETSAAPPEVVWPEGTGPRVFLAATDEDIGHLHRQLKKALEKEGFRVLHSVPPPHDVSEHSARVKAIVGSADLLVHLLGDGPGATMDGVGEGDASLRTYPMEQLAIGLESNCPQLVLIPLEVDIDAADEPDYATYVVGLERSTRDGKWFRLIRNSNQAPRDLVFESWRAIEAARQAAASAAESASTVTRAFVDAQPVDLPHSQTLESYLVERNVEVQKKISTQSPTEAVSQFDVNLAKFPLYLVVSGAAKAEWVDKRVEAAVKSAIASKAKSNIGLWTPTPEPGTAGPFVLVTSTFGADASTWNALFKPSKGVA
jgi:CHAT domain